MPYKRLRGTHDIFGEDALNFKQVEAAAHKVFSQFGFSELRTPILEEKELFTRALGTETDVVQKEMYEFQDRSGGQVAMRPEGTAGIVRAYLENELDKSEGLCKFYYLGAMFRSERPQAGRLRQFHQVGAEILGVDTPAADAEAILAMIALLDRLGIEDYKLRLNNLGTLEERDIFRQVLKDYFTPKVDQLCEDCKHRLQKNVFRLLDCKNETCRSLVKHSPQITGYLTEASKAHFDQVVSLLEKARVHFVLDPFMVRGLDYYTKTVFEVSHPKLGSQDALGAGGRYDRLIETFGGARAGAVGFALGIERLLMSLPESPKASGYQPSFFVATMGEAAQMEGFGIVSLLRREGFTALLDLQAKSIKSQMRQADRHRTRYVIILGDNELQEKKFVLKDMQTSEQKEYLLEKLIEVAGLLE